MLDLIALVLIAVLFGLSFAYTHSCDLLKGDPS